MGSTDGLQDAENNWQFDVFGFAEATPGHTLSLLTFHLLQSTGQIQDRQYDATRLARYIRKVEAGYLESNPYHNRYELPQREDSLCHGCHVDAIKIVQAFKE